MIKRRKRLLVPRPVSKTIKVKKDTQVTFLRVNPGQTRVFVESGSGLHRLPKGLSAQEKYLRLKDAGYRSSHFIKPLSQRAQRIRTLVERNDIRVEKVIQDLGDGTALFERTGFSLDSPQGQRIFFSSRKKALKNIGVVLHKMHSLGVSHNHLHAGNIALTKKGEVVLLDFGLARISSKQRAKKGLNSASLAKDLFLAANSIATIEKAHFGKKKSIKVLTNEILLQFLENYPLETTLKLEKGFERLVERSKALKKKK